MKKWGMKNGEVFDTDTGGELVVNNSLEDGSDDASDRDFKGFHRVVGLKSILADCATVHRESCWSTSGKRPARQQPKHWSSGGVRRANGQHPCRRAAFDFASRSRSAKAEFRHLSAGTHNFPLGFGSKITYDASFTRRTGKI